MPKPTRTPERIEAHNIAQAIVSNEFTDALSGKGGYTMKSVRQLDGERAKVLATAYLELEASLQNPAGEWRPKNIAGIWEALAQYVNAQSAKDINHEFMVDAVRRSPPLALSVAVILLEQLPSAPTGEVE